MKSTNFPARIDVPATEKMKKEVRIAAAHAGVSNAQFVRDAVEVYLRAIKLAETAGSVDNLIKGLIAEKAEKLLKNLEK
jgi:hypothetical protein